MFLVAGFFFIGCGPMEEDDDCSAAYSSATPVTDDWRPETEVILDDVLWISQAPPSLDCGPTTLEMAWAFLDGEIPTYDPGVIDIMAWMDEHVDTYDNGGLTNMVELAYTSLWYLQLPAEAFGDDLCISIGGLEGLYNELLLGKPVGFSSYGQEANASTAEMTADGTGHAMLLVGMTPTEIVVHDSSQSSDFGAYRRFSIESFDRVGWNSHGGVRFMP
ncbi:MAG: C39 family peptidase [Patescibacteria group bacterium]